MRLKLLKLSWLVVSLLVAGCMSPIDANDGGGETDIVKPDPLPDDGPSPSIAEGIHVTASQDAFDEIKSWLGDGNTITVANPMKIEQPEVSVHIPGGATVAYKFDDTSGTFSFASPKPTIEAKIWGWTVRPTLSQVTLQPAGDGTAKTSLGSYKFRWLADDEDTGTAAIPETLPEVWCYSMANCPSCEKAKKDFETAVKIMPFKPVWKEKAPAWMASSRPAFWWHTSKNEPSQDEINATRQRTGYSTLKDLLDTWGKTRETKKIEPAKSFQEGQPAVSVVADRDQKRSVDRTVKFHEGHNCWSCGRTQYTIWNQQGPASKTHIHRCNHCLTLWYHKDQ